MDTPLDQAKRRVRDAYLGRDGVHAVGVRKADNAVAVYAEPGSPVERPHHRQRLQDLAKPCAVLVVSSPQATARPGD